MKRARSVVEVLVVASTMVVATTVAPSVNAAADGRIRVLQETPLSPVADVPADVRKDCESLGDELPRALARSSRRVTLVPNRHDPADTCPSRSRMCAPVASAPSAVPSS
jgi:hypothetical protein